MMESINPQEYKILLVDDLEIQRVAFTKILQKEGYEVETSNDGFNALEKLNSFTPDVVILDVNLPNMDGFEICSKIMDTNENVNIIMTSGIDSSEITEKAIERGAKDFLSKPFSGPDLISLLEKNITHNCLKDTN